METVRDDDDADLVLISRRDLEAASARLRAAADLTARLQRAHYDRSVDERSYGHAWHDVMEASLGAWNALADAEGRLTDADRGYLPGEPTTMEGLARFFEEYTAEEYAAGVDQGSLVAQFRIWGANPRVWGRLRRHLAAMAERRAG